MPIAKGFRRFLSNILSYRQVTEVSNLVRGSNIQHSGRPSAARFSSTRPIRKRVTSADRRAMLKSFVDKYRAMNMGKFPSPTSAQKEVGGGYYSIKKMLQEMEYNIKISCVENGVVKEIKKQTKSEDTISRKVAIESSGSQDKSNIQIAIDQQLSEDPWIESVSNFDSTSELREEIKPSTSSGDTGNNNVTREEIKPSASSGDTENNNITREEIKPSTSSGDTGNNSITRDDAQNVAPEIHDRKCHEKVINTLYAHKQFDLKNLESKVEHQDDGIRNITSEQQKKDELREETSLWGNLKSIATSFINIWRKG